MRSDFIEDPLPDFAGFDEVGRDDETQGGMHRSILPALTSAALAHRAGRARRVGLGSAGALGFGFRRVAAVGARGLAVVAGFARVFIFGTNFAGGFAGAGSSRCHEESSLKR
jgi:hypothetical protein